MAVDSTGLRASERGEQTFGHPKFQTSAKCSERAIRTVQDGVQVVATFCGPKCVLATLLVGKSDRLQQLVSSPKRKERKEYYTRCESIIARIDIYSPCTPGITYVSVTPNTRFEEQPEDGHQLSTMSPSATPMGWHIQPNPNKTPNRSFHPLFTTNRAPPPYSSASHSKYRASNELSGPSSNDRMSLGVT